MNVLRPPTETSSSSSKAPEQAAAASAARPELGNFAVDLGDDESESARLGAAASPSPPTTSSSRPRVAWSRVALSVGLLVTGGVLIVVGAGVSSWAAALVGVLAAIPGSYGVYAYWQASRGNARYQDFFAVEDEE